MHNPFPPQSLQMYFYLVPEKQSILGKQLSAFFYKQTSKHCLTFTLARLVAEILSTSLIKNNREKLVAISSQRLKTTITISLQLILS